MADTKLSALTELAATPAVDDEVYIRDISEAAADESKRITTANLLASRAILTVAETEVFNGTEVSSWTDLNLSGVVGANPALVLLKVNGDAVDFAVRKNGDTDEFFDTDTSLSSGAALLTTSSALYGVLIVATDASGIIEWITDGASETVTIDVIAYIK